MRKLNFTFKSMKAFMLAMMLMASMVASAQIGKRIINDDGSVISEQNIKKRVTTKNMVVAKKEYKPSAEATFYDGFDTYDDWTTGFGDWTLINGNAPNNCIGLGINGTPEGYVDYSFPREATPYAAIILNPSQTSSGWDVNTPEPSDMYIPAHSGEKYAAFFVSYTGATWPANDKWMISPKVSIGAEEGFSFYAKAGDFTFNNQTIEVLVSTTGTNQGDFTKIATETVRNTEWKRFDYLLKNYGYANQDVYFAIRDVSISGSGHDEIACYTFIDDVKSVPVSVTAEPEMLISEWNAGMATVADTIVSKEFILCNIGQEPLRINSISGLEGTDFSTSLYAADVILDWQETYAFTFTFMPTKPGTKDVEVIISTNGGDLSFNLSGKTADESFEGIVVPEGSYTTTELPEGWKSIKADGGIREWVVQKGNNHTGGKSLSSDNENNIKTDDWIITPALNIVADRVDNIAFYVDRYYWDEAGQYEVRLSTTGVEVTDFAVLLETASTNIEYELKEYNLDAYDGQVVYVAIRNITSGGIDGSMFLDDFFMPELFVPEIDLCFKSFSGNTRPSLDNEEIYTVKLKNTGKQPVTDYKVQLLKVVEGAADEVLAQTVQFESLNSGEEISVNVNHTFTVEENVELYAKVVLDTDEDASNNKSQVYTFKVLASNMGSFTAGDGQVVMNAPIYQLSKRTFTEVIYNQSELALQGQISELSFYNNYLSGAAMQEPIRIWLGVTSKSSFSVGNDLIGPADMTLVFDGLLDLPAGQNRIDIPIEPFMYMGGNLVMLVERDSEVFFSNSQTYFGAASTDNCTVQYGSFSESIDSITKLSIKEYQLKSYIPKTTFTFLAEFGSLEGTISSSGAKLENAKVSVVNSHFNYITSANGIFEFPALAADTYSLNAVCHGYYDALVEGIVVEKDGYVVQDIEMTALPKLTVNALIKGSDDILLDNASITIEGYDEVYTGTTAANGSFTIANIYGEKTYVITIEREGYETLITDFTLTTTDVDLGTLVLTETTHKPEFVTTIVDYEKEEALINWYAPWSGTSTTYQYDTDTHANSYAIEAILNSNYWIGNKFDVADEGAISAIAIHGWSKYHEVDQFVTVDIMNDEEGVVWTSEPFEMPAAEWMMIDVPDVRFDGKFHVMVHFNNLAGTTNSLHYDANGENVAMYYSTAEGFIPMGDLVGTSGAFRIRTMANIYGKSVKLEGGKTKRTFDSAIELPKMNMIKSDANVEFNAFNTENRDSKVLESYKVYRGLHNDTFENFVELTPNTVSDTFYVDNNFGALENNIYKYAVTSVYTNGVESAPAFSNLTHNSVVVPLSFNITTNEIGESNVEGAVVYATNYDGYSDHAYEIVVPANGIVELMVATGNYDIRVEKEGFISYEEVNVNISSAQTFNVELQESLSAPENLMVLNKENGRAVFSWNNAFSEITEDFETGALPGDWSFIDADGDGHNWGLIIAGAGAVSGTYSAVSHSFDNGSGQPLSPENYMVSPKLYVGPDFVVDFYAWAQDGNYPAETFKVKISTSGMEPEDFTYTVVDHTLTANGDGMPVPDHFTVDLSEFAGRKIFVAFVHDGYDQNAMSIDNIYIGQNKDAKSLINYEVSLSGESLGSTNDKQMDFVELANGQTYVAGVKAIYSSGESVEAQFEFVYTPGIIEYILQVGTEANCDLDITGAEINLVNKNGDQAQIYNEVLPESKELQFMIVPGEYNLTIAKAGFVTYEYTGVEISANTTELVLMEEDRKKPLNLDVTELSTTEAKMTWEMESSEKSIIGFRTYLDGQEQGMTTNMEYVFTNLENGTYYEFGVKALYTTGESEMSVFNHAFVVNGVEVLESELTVYPVPARNELYVEWNTPNLTIEVYNLIGQILNVVEATSTKTRIDVSDLNNGIYILKLKSENQEVVRKVAVRK